METALLTVHQFCEANPGFTEGGVRHAIFYKGDELESVGAVVRFGRRILVDEARWNEWVRSGGARSLSSSSARSLSPATVGRSLR